MVFMRDICATSTSFEMANNCCSGNGFQSRHRLLMHCWHDGTVVLAECLHLLCVCIFSICAHVICFSSYPSLALDHDHDSHVESGLCNDHDHDHGYDHGSIDPLNGRKVLRMRVVVDRMNETEGDGDHGEVRERESDGVRIDHG